MRMHTTDILMRIFLAMGYEREFGENTSNGKNSEHA